MTVAERVKEFFHNEGIHSTTIQVGIPVTFTNGVTLWQSKAIFFHSSFSLSLLRLRSQPAASPPPRIVCSPALNQGPLTRLKRNFHGTTLRDSTAVHRSQKGHLLGGPGSLGNHFQFLGPHFLNFRLLPTLRIYFYESHFVSENEVQTNGVLC